VNALSDDIKAQIEGLFPFLSLPSPSSSFTSPHSSSTYNKPESERPKNLLRTLSRGLDKTVSDAQERLSYCAEIKMRVEVQFFEPLPSHLAYPGIIEAQEEKKAARLAAKNESIKQRNKNHKKDDNKNSNADGNMNGNGNGSREGDGDDGDNDGDIGRHEEMGKLFYSFIFICIFIVCVAQQCSSTHIIPLLVSPLPSTSQLLPNLIQFHNSNWSHLLLHLFNCPSYFTSRDDFFLFHDDVLFSQMTYRPPGTPLSCTPSLSCPSSTAALKSKYSNISQVS
jgi:hypothetical protein